MNPEKKHYKEILEMFKTNVKLGLDKKQVAKAQEFFGENKINEKKRQSIIVKFFMQFNDFMIIVLLIAAGVSLGVSYLNGNPDYVDTIIILTIVILNAILGLVQENKAEKSLEALQKMSAPRAKVLRDGEVEYIDTEKLVPGDIIYIESGDFIPADARLIESYNLKLEESALTGESIPVEKDEDIVIDKNVPIGDRKNMVFSSSSVTSGRGIAIVCFTGMDTEVGKIAAMILTDESPQTPLQKKLESTGKFLGVGALVICGIIFMLGIFQQKDPFDMFMTSVSLAVAAIPEGLPAIVTIMLAIGVQRMAKKNAIIRKLPAVETLGSANVICSDKTGTLTQNKMKVVEIANHSGKLPSISSERNLILKYGALCNDSIVSDDKSILGDPTETAIVVAALNININKNLVEEKYKRVMEIPFDSQRKLMTTIHKNKDESEHLVITKGAPDVLIERCNYYYDGDNKIQMTKEKRRQLLATNVNMAEKALRVLAISYKNVKFIPSEMGGGTFENDLVFLGFIGMMDPPRENVKESVATCKKAGIKPVMVTGDHIITAKAIATKIGIMGRNDLAMAGHELEEMTQEQLNKVVDNYSVFARLSPEHKVRIVQAYQSQGNVVAMTGDGVNDAPALKIADIGCAMGISGTDVAKSASDMILADDNFSTIVHAVKEGRGIYKNVRKAIHFLLSSNIGEIITIFMAILFGFETPLLPIHLLWVNLVTDSLPAIALGLDPATDDLMDEKPVNKNQSLFGDGLWLRIAIEGTMIGMLALIAFSIGTVYFDQPGSRIIGRTMAFTTLSISQLVHAFNMRSEKSILKINIFENMYLIGAFIVGTVSQVLLVTVEPLRKIFKVSELGFESWIIVMLLCVVPILLVELEKYVDRKNNDKQIIKSAFSN